MRYLSLPKDDDADANVAQDVFDTCVAMVKDGRCPFCGIGTVNTLDHYLPKTHFPVLSVTPHNLVPACMWCQGKKMEYCSTTAGGQLLHPYFDDFNQDVWLAAEVVVGSPPAFRYRASPPVNWPQDEKTSVASDLKELNLGSLFGSNAGADLRRFEDDWPNCTMLVELMQC